MGVNSVTFSYQNVFVTKIIPSMSIKEFFERVIMPTLIYVNIYIEKFYFAVQRLRIELINTYWLF